METTIIYQRFPCENAFTFGGDFKQPLGGEAEA